jgi:hypothetical protein
MYIVSRDAGWGRNFWKWVDNGTVNVHSGGEFLCATVRNGILTKIVNHNKDEYITLTYGEGLTKKGPGRISEQVYYEPGTLQAIKRSSCWKRKKGVQLCGSKGTVECYSTSNGAYGREVFTYRNGKQGYVASRWRKQLKVRRPNGRLWMVIKGAIRLNFQTLAERLGKDLKNPEIWYCMRQNNWDVTMYDKDGQTVVTQGHVEGRQKQGKWLENGKVAYYISGVRVSRKLYKDDPENWNAAEVLRIPNAQLRCSLLNRMGYDRLLEKIQPRIISQGNDGGQLLEVSSGLKPDNRSGVDNMMHLVKVICPSTSQVYVLRVPPEIADYEQARQWTFGLQEESLQQGARFELVKET